MKRRRFLKMGLLGGALLGVGGVGLAIFPSRKLHSPKRRTHVFAASEFNVLALAAAVVIKQPDVDAAEIAHGVDEAMSRNSTEAQEDFRSLLKLLENGLAGLLLDGRPSNFSRLDEEGRASALRNFRDSRIAARRSGYHALRKLCLAAYYADEKRWEKIGYPGPPQISAPVGG
jgi:hypothetical protein